MVTIGLVILVIVALLLSMLWAAETKLDRARRNPPPRHR